MKTNMRIKPIKLQATEAAEAAEAAVDVGGAVLRFNWTPQHCVSLGSEPEVYEICDVTCCHVCFEAEPPKNALNTSCPL